MDDGSLSELLSSEIYPPRCRSSLPSRRRQRPSLPPRRRNSSITTTEANSIHNSFKSLNRYEFTLPSSDALIRGDNRDSIPAYPLPTEHDDFTIVRRYLYNALTTTGWGLSETYLVAVRCTVEGWHGNGGFFRQQCENEDGLLNLCPEGGKNDSGEDVWFVSRIRDAVRECVRYESYLLVQQGEDETLEEAGDSTSVALSYKEDCARQGLEVSKEAEAKTHENDTETGFQADQDRRLVYSVDYPSLSKPAEETRLKYHTLPCYFKTRCHSASVFASLYQDLIAPNKESLWSPTVADLTTESLHPNEAEHVEVKRSAPPNVENGHNITIPSWPSQSKRTKSLDFNRLTLTPGILRTQWNKHKCARPAAWFYGCVKTIWKYDEAGYATAVPSKDKITPEPESLIGFRYPESIDQQQNESEMDQVGEAATTVSRLGEKIASALVAKEEEDMVTAAAAAARRAQDLEIDQARLFNHHERKNPGFLSRSLCWIRVFGRRNKYAE